MKTRINILNNNHQATFTGISGTFFINIPTCFGQCKATSRKIIIKDMTELWKAFVNFYSRLKAFNIKTFQKKVSFIGVRIVFTLLNPPFFPLQIYYIKL